MKKTLGQSIKSALLVTTVVFGASFLGTGMAQAQADFDSLGSNEGILKRARALSTQQKVRIVQKRAVDRNLRFEFGGSYGGVTGGNSYLSTQPMTGSIEFHINPRISIGARYSQYTNQLSNEGKSQFEAARSAHAAGRTDYTVPEIDLPKSSMMGTISYYPMYGKLNFFDLSVVQFDFYVVGGYGQMELKSGNSSTWTAGGGVGFWWSKHFSSRFEVRHQAYQDKVHTGTRDIGMVVGTIGIGLLL
ncbi:MAG: outer membrane beta-barrel domain-containing protein [Bdellovibrionales bacterium]|jgi:outer membrane beta-barrel protein|nr:outer membrane beta-barrel domain-containing protein [Bdellovibrionales bacterium]